MFGDTAEPCSPGKEEEPGEVEEEGKPTEEESRVFRDSPLPLLGNITEGHIVISYHDLFRAIFGRVSCFDQIVQPEEDRQWD
jgi:hypothetical protein